MKRRVGAERREKAEGASTMAKINLGSTRLVYLQVVTVNFC